MTEGDRPDGSVPAPPLPWLARSQYRRAGRDPRIPAATHRQVRVVTDLPVRMPDGVELLTDHWFADGATATTVLIRTPYGKDSVAAPARIFAERGYHVVVQACRGTFGSGGRQFEPFEHEQADGRATMAWVRAQPWAAGPVHTWGGSYLGLTQWSMCGPQDRPDAMVVALSARRFDEAMIYAGGGFAMETAVVWSHALRTQEHPAPRRLLELALAPRQVRRACLAVPPETADELPGGDGPGLVRRWLAHAEPGDPWWTRFHFAADPGDVPPVVLLAGWQDLFLDGGVSDYRALRDAGRPVRLVIGDWTHASAQVGVAAVREALDQLRDLTATHQQAPVSVEVTGGGGWRSLPGWPPPAAERDWLLAAGGRLVDDSHRVAESSTAYRFDPADPTPQAGGRTLNPFAAGRRSQRRREARADVLTFTGPVLERDLVVIGEPFVDLALTSTNPRIDLFVRLCDVGARGVSRTVTEGYVRLAPAPADGPRRVRLPLGPTGHRFAASHRLRLQVSSGAHPLHLRNSGTADPLRDFDRMRPSDQQLHLGGSDPARLVVPVLP